MTNAEKRNYVLTPEECDYIEKLILNNETIVRAVIRSVLGEKFDQIGGESISDLYLLMCEKIDLLKRHENPEGWMVVSARYVALNALRRYNTLLYNTDTKKIEDICSEENVFESALYNIWIKDGVIDKALATLTPHEKEIYNYLYRERLSYKKIAEIMDISESTVRNTNATIRRKILNEMQKYGF